MTAVPRRFCVVYVVGTDFRLMRTANSEPGIWAMSIPIDQGLAEITVRDILAIEDEIPIHRGIQIEVEIPNSSEIDEAVTSAGKVAEAVVSLLSAAARAYAPEILPVVAYDNTPLVSDRQLIQWQSIPNFPVGKTPVPPAAFNLLWQKLPTLPQRSAERMRLALDWHRQALHETEPLFRFFWLWTALEAIGNPMSELYSVDKQGWQGLRRLAEDLGQETNLISKILNIRRKLFHSMDERPAYIRSDAIAIVPSMEALLIAAWARILGEPDVSATFPSSTVTPSPMRAKMRAVLADLDASRWTGGIHPGFTAKFKWKRTEDGTTDQITGEYMIEFTPHNIEQWRSESIEIWGPSGPNISRMSYKDGVVVKGDSTKENQ